MSLIASVCVFVSTAMRFRWSDEMWIIIFLNNNCIWAHVQTLIRSLTHPQSSIRPSQWSPRNLAAVLQKTVNPTRSVWHFSMLKQPARAKLSMGKWEGDLLIGWCVWLLFEAALKPGCHWQEWCPLLILTTRGRRDLANVWKKKRNLWSMWEKK